MTIRLITAFIISLLFVTLFGKYYIPWLKKEKAGQEIKEEVTWHKSKAGTPTLGGVMIIFATLLILLTVGFEGMLNGHYIHFFVFLFALVFGGIGFLDDWEKVKRKQNLGLSANAKFLLQFIASVVFIVLVKKFGYLSNNLYIPFVNKYVFVPEWFYVILSAFIIVGTVNAVNITDGLDGLCAGTSIPVFLFFTTLCFVVGNQYIELGIFSSAILGALIGFLYYNYNPAQIFLGDTGSLFLGGAIVALAFAYDMPLILVTLGIIYIIETLSDIIQISYFKVTHGKRVFKMAPFHHHLELGGWSGKKRTEKEIFAIFTLVSLVFSIISFIGVYGRYI